MFRFALSLALSIILMSCNETKNNSDLVGVWQLHCAYNGMGGYDSFYAENHCYSNAPIYNMEFFSDGTGIAYVYASSAEPDTFGISYPYKWQADSSHLQMIIENASGAPDTNDYEIVYFKEENLSKIKDFLNINDRYKDISFSSEDQSFKMPERSTVEHLLGIEPKFSSKDLLFRTELGGKNYNKDIEKLNSEPRSKARLNKKPVLKTYRKIPGAANPATKIKSAFTDARDGKTYKTVKIGEQTWMAENLDYDMDGSKCHEGSYDDKIAEQQIDCAKYGRGYTWEAAMKACPKGWRLPDNKEWDKLYRYASLATTDSTGNAKYIGAGKFLKAVSGWNWILEFEGYLGPGNGMDRFGFSALQSYLYATSSFMKVGAAWWSASQNNISDRHSLALKTYSHDFLKKRNLLDSINTNIPNCVILFSNQYLTDDLYLESCESTDAFPFSVRCIKN